MWAKRSASILPATDTLIRNAIAALKSEGQLIWLEALTMAPEIHHIVSEVVGKVAPEIKGTSARELVILVSAAGLVAIPPSSRALLAHLSEPAYDRHPGAERKRDLGQAETEDEDLGCRSIAVI